jgi:hypothetical protein
MLGGVMGQFIFPTEACLKFNPTAPKFHDYIKKNNITLPKTKIQEYLVSLKSSSTSGGEFCDIANMWEISKPLSGKID